MLQLKNTFKFGTKADTLISLQDKLTLAGIPEIFTFSVAEYSNNPDMVLERIQGTFGRQKVVVRSSTISEDGERAAMAGVYHSELNVSTSEKSILKKTIEKVIGSYSNTSRELNEKDQVLVQRMIDEVTMSGVVFTQDMNTGAPYYVINYDDESGRTDTVTGGAGICNKTLLVHRDSVNDLHSERFLSLIHAIKEIEQVTSYDALDIEYAVGPNLEVYIFQVRKITTRPNWNRGITLRVNDAVKRLRVFAEHSFEPKPGVFGSRSLFGQMPDWNPVEMIGSAPRPLALSLYRTLITDKAWREARRQMGYAEPKGAPLMVSMVGLPYIDVRFSFHSYLPADIQPALAHKIVDCWLARLTGRRELHDKVEFEIAITALPFDFDELVATLMGDTLSDGERAAFKENLRNLTGNLLSGKVASIPEQLEKIDRLETLRHELLRGNTEPNLQTVKALLEDCYLLGTIPFSILARHAFIARSLLLSLVRLGVLDESEVQALQMSVKTVAGEFVDDLEQLESGKKDMQDFLGRYGHLRPGTYDILSLRYDQRQDLIGRLKTLPENQAGRLEFAFSAAQEKAINALLRKTGFSVDAGALLEYVRVATSAREYAKFVFTRNISDSLEIIASWGESNSLSRDEISFLTITDILDSIDMVQGRTLEQSLREKSLAGRDQHELTMAMHLPHLITEPADISIVPLMYGRPNFITRKKVQKEYVLLNGRDEKPPALDDKIVLIEGADPGFDWIFSFPLAGLITKFGGANSHMAIRCSEFGLPAAIGVGEQIFDRIIRSRKIELNCAEGLIIPLEV